MFFPVSSTPLQVLDAEMDMGPVLIIRLDLHLEPIADLKQFYLVWSILVRQKKNDIPEAPDQVKLLEVRYRFQLDEVLQ